MQRRGRYWSRVAALVLACMPIAVPGLAQQVDVKGEKEVIALGQKVDRAGASGHAGQVSGKIVDQWKGTPFRFDAASAPRELTTQDVQLLRLKRFGYGEISILLALAAKQPDAARAKSLNEILAMRQAGSGWGKIAHALGYPSLGAVKRSVKATEAGVERVAASGRAQNLSRLEKADRTDKPAKAEQR